MLSLLFGWFLFPCVLGIDTVFLNVLEPESIVGEYLGVPAVFGPEFSESVLYNELVIADPWMACEPLKGDYTGKLVLASRGNCSFTTKVENAQNSGAAYVVIANDQDGTVAIGMAGDGENVTIPSFMISEHDGLHIKRDTPAQVTIEGYVRPEFDFSVIILMGTAVAVVAASAYWASERERKESQAKSLGLPPPPLGEEFIPPTYLNEKMAAGFVVVASVSLLLLFYFLSSLIWLLIIFFAIGGLEGTVACSSALAHHLLPLHLHRPVNVPWIGQVSIITVSLFPLCLTLSIIWVVFRHESWAWVLQNMLSICILMMIQKVVRLPNIKVSSILLVTAFLYDIFWVFISPLLFSSSVMVTVATGGDTGESVPMLISMPRFNDRTGGFSLLGLGDIALPGMFISFLIRFDYSKGLTRYCTGYFKIGVIGYAVGMFLTDMALVIMQSGQPALLYLVPCTLGVTVALAAYRGHLREMWKGIEGQGSDHHMSLLDADVENAFTALPNDDLDNDDGPITSL